MATSSNSSRPSVSPHRLSHCTPIEEGNEDEEISQGQTSFRNSTPSDNISNNIQLHHHPTPLHQNSSHGRSEESSKKKNTCGVSCNNCRPTSKGKILMVPADNRESLTSPTGLFKSIFSSLVKKSPGLFNVQSPAAPVTKEEQWKIAATELSQKLIKARRNRDEAVLEISRLKISITELEKKLNKLEIYCQNLKSGLELCNSESQLPKNALLDVNYQIVKIGDQTSVIENFLVSVSEARSSVKLLSRALFFLLKQMGGKVFDKLSLHLQPYGGEKTSSLPRNNRDLFLYFEALFNRVFYEDFESIGFQKSAPTRILNPIDRCEANMATFHRLKRLTWDEVLTKGTKHFSEEFSKFCDRKMSEIVSMLGWNRAWPEKLLQSFFIASKDVWLVHVLANSVHPSLAIFRVDKGSGFDSVYMEDIGGEKVRNLVPSIVGIMVAPGFYVYDNVVKCKVVCRYQNIMVSNGINKASIQPSESNHQIVVVHDPMVPNARPTSERSQESPVLQ